MMDSLTLLSLLVRVFHAMFERVKRDKLLYKKTQTSNRFPGIIVPGCRRGETNFRIVETVVHPAKPGKQLN